MRDVGILVWVVFLVIGVIGSMVSSVRRQAAAGTQPKPVPQWKPPSGPPPAATAPQRLIGVPQTRVQVPAARPLPSPAPRAQTAPQARPTAPPPSPTPPASGRRLFGSGSELVRAVIAAEVLGKPRGLHDEYRQG
jgi:hypothetical protein